MGKLGGGGSCPAHLAAAPGTVLLPLPLPCQQFVLPQRSPPAATPLPCPPPALPSPSHLRAGHPPQLRLARCTDHPPPARRPAPRSPASRSPPPTKGTPSPVCQAPCRPPPWREEAPPASPWVGSSCGSGRGGAGGGGAGSGGRVAGGGGDASAAGGAQAPRVCGAHLGSGAVPRGAPPGEVLGRLQRPEDCTGPLLPDREGPAECSQPREGKAGEEPVTGEAGMARPAPGWRRGGSVIVGGYAGIGDRRPSGCAPPFRASK